MSQQNCNQTLRRVTKFVILSLVLRAEYTILVQINVVRTCQKNKQIEPAELRFHPRFYFVILLAACGFTGITAHLHFVSKFPLIVEI